MISAVESPTALHIQKSVYYVPQNDKLEGYSQFPRPRKVLKNVKVRSRFNIVPSEASKTPVPQIDYLTGTLSSNDLRTLKLLVKSQTLLKEHPSKVNREQTIHIMSETIERRKKLLIKGKKR